MTLDIQGSIRKPFLESELFDTIGKVLGLDYKYEKEKEITPRSGYLINPETLDDAISKLPTELMTQILNAVEAADFNLLTDLIKTITSGNQELGYYLMTLVHNYNYSLLAQIFIKNRDNE